MFQSPLRASMLPMVRFPRVKKSGVITLTWNGGEEKPCPLSG